MTPGRTIGLSPRYRSSQAWMAPPALPITARYRGVSTTTDRSGTCGSSFPGRRGGGLETGGGGLGAAAGAIGASAFGGAGLGSLGGPDRERVNHTRAAPAPA